MLALGAPLTLILVIPPVLSWTIDVHPDVSYPPRWTAPPGDRYMSKNGTFLSPNYLDSCLNALVPENVTRSKFHVSNGRAVFDLVNSTAGNPTNESFHVDVYLPHLWYRYVDPPNGTLYNSGRQGRFKSRNSMWRFFYWQNFPQQGRCYLPLNMTNMTVDENDNTLSPKDLVGLNATLNFELMNVRNYRTFEQVDQCSYVTLTDEDVQPKEDIVPCESFNPNSPLAPSKAQKSQGARICWQNDLLIVVVAFVYLFAYL